MVAITRTSMINSNNTQINSDYDFSMLRKKILGWESGILKAGDFFLDKNNRRFSAVSPIAEAVILCTRATSYPIGNQTFYAHFQFTGTIENISVDEGTKIFIEIKENLILDPSLISDSDGRSDYAKWFWIGEIKIAKNYPSHTNYLPLWEIQGGQAVDKRKVISMPELDEVASRTSTLESKVKTSETKITELEDKWTPQYLGKFVVVEEAYQSGDVMVEKWGKLVKKQKKISQAFTVPSSFNGYYFVGTINIPRGDKVIVDLRWRIFTSSWTFEKIRVLSNKKYSSMQDYKNNPWTVYATSYWDDWEVVEFIKNDDWPVYFSVMCSSQYGAYINSWSVDVEINNWIWSAPLYPREVKGVGERVECTIMGLHSNGDLIQPKPVEIVIGKEMSGTFTATREAPNSWYLEVSYRTGSSDSQYWWINIWEVGLNTSRDNRTERIFVQKWPIVLKGWGREGYAINTYLKLEKFTSVM